MTVRLVPVLAALLGAQFLISAPIKAAGECDADLKVVDEALAKKQLADDERDQLEDMRSQAQALCDSGNTDEGLELSIRGQGHSRHRVSSGATSSPVPSAPASRHRSSARR